MPRQPFPLMRPSRPVQLELGQHFNAHGAVRGEALDEGQRLLRRAFGAGGRQRAPKPTDAPQPSLAHMDAMSFNVGAWVARAEWLERHSRSAQDHYDQLAQHARALTPELIRSARHQGALRDLEDLLRDRGWEVHRYWSRARLGELIVEATNRARQLEIGRIEPKLRGPALDPARLPDDRLEHLIQTHRDLAVVEALRAERERRSRATDNPAA